MFTNDNNIGYTPYPKKQEPDYSKMTLRQELETRFADMEQQKKTQQCMKPEYTLSYSAWPNLPTGYMAKNRVNDEQLNKFSQYIQNNTPTLTLSPQKGKTFQSLGAVYDMTKNYINMIKDNTINADDYFHCKANYEAAKRGQYGKNTAERLGQLKEIYDIYDNIVHKDMTLNQALDDYNHDMLVNEIGRLQALSRQYSNSKDGCNIFRVKGINNAY